MMFPWPKNRKMPTFQAVIFLCGNKIHTLRVQKYGNDGLKHGGKDVLWPMSLVTKGDFLSNPDLNLNTYGGKIFAISSSVYQTDKDKFWKNFL